MRSKENFGEDPVHMSTFYGEDGESSEGENSPYSITCARHISTVDGSTYFIRRGRGKLYNPVKVSARDKTKSYWKMVAVKEGIFDLYVDFLKTKSASRLRLAERQI